MKKSEKFSDLIVWQKAHQFVLEFYRLTKNFPRDQTYGLTQQFRRASVSIPANIAEGFRKRGKNDKVIFLNISEGSLQECKYYLILSKDLKYTADNLNLTNLAEEVSKLLDAYSKAILYSVS
jgi:four helix bundle protein